MYTYSRYNHLIENGNNYLLYNLATEEIMALQPDIAELLIQNKDCITKLSSIHPSLYEILISKSFIVSSAINEVERLIQF